MDLFVVNRHIQNNCELFKHSVARNKQIQALDVSDALGLLVRSIYSQKTFFWYLCILSFNNSHV